MNLVSGSTSDMLSPLIPVYLVSLVFGWLWQGVSSWAAFGFSGACALLAAVLLRFWVFYEGRPQQAS